MTKPSLAAGRRKLRISIDRPIKGRRASGQDVVVGWELVCKPWANASQPKGREFVTAGLEVAEVSTSFRIPWRTNLTTDMRIRAAGATYEITAVLLDLVDREHVDLVAVAGKRKA